MKASRFKSLRFLLDVSRYFGPVRWRLVVGSIAGIAMNTAAVLPPLLLGNAIDSALAFSQGHAAAAQVGWAAALFVGGTLATEGPRMLKRWFLITANARIRADLRADAVRGVLAWPMARVHETPVGELIARIIGDVEVIGVGVREANVATTRLRAVLQPVYSLLMVSGVLIVVWKGGEHVVGGAMTVGGFVAYLEIFLRFTARAPRIPQLINSVQSGASAFERLRPLLPARPPGAPAAQHLARQGAAAVRFHEVTFRYPGSSEPALRDLTLEIPAGTLVAVTGPVGSGKSALARALLCLHPLDRGTIQLDGAPASHAFAAGLRGRVGILPQEPLLFSGSIRENVLLDDRTDSETKRDAAAALQVAGMGRDLEDFPDGIETQIGELGVRLSGGQRQRVGLARAIAAAAPSRLLVLDDPFSAIDVDTEVRIIDSLRDAFGPAAPPNRRSTIVLCSHRLAAFPRADLVVVLDKGRVVEKGTHASLMEQESLYARIFRAQCAEARHEQVAV